MNAVLLENFNNGQTENIPAVQDTGLKTKKKTKRYKEIQTNMNEIKHKRTK